MKKHIGLITLFLLLMMWTIGLGDVYGDWEYSLSNGQVTITAYIGTTADVIVPSTINGYRVTSIGDYAFGNNYTIRSVTFPESVSRFGFGVFVASEYLTTVSLPSRMIALGDLTFSGCKNLTSIHIPKGITTIGESCFSGCSSLNSISLPDSVSVIDLWAFSGCSALQSITLPPHVTAINKGAFSSCSSLTSISIPETVTTIGDEAFGYCTSLVSISIPDSVTALGSGAFKECAVLSSVILSKNITSIGAETFYNCKSLLSVHLPDNITFIDNSAFSGCTTVHYCNYSSNTAKALSKVGKAFYDTHYPDFVFRYEYTDSEITDLTLVSADSEIVEANIPDGVTKIGYYAFHNHKNLITITFPESVRSIDDIAFNGCTGLTTIALPDSVTSIGIEAFGNCTNLVSISMPKRMSTIGIGAFRSCNGLTSFTVPNGITTISDSTFMDCSALQSVTIPFGVTKIENGAFRNCTRLSSITFPNSLTHIGTYSFMSCYSLISVTIPDSVTLLGGGPFAYCKSLTSVVLPKGITAIEADSFAHCSSLQSIVIPYGVTSIGPWAFSGCTSLHSVTIPDTVTTFAHRVFNQCTSLTHITLPDGLNSIGSGVFYGCSNLVSVNIPDALTTINSETFYGCSRLQSISIPDGVTLIDSKAFEECSSLRSVNWSETLKTINANAFSHTALTSINLPETVETIGEKAFFDSDDQPIHIYVPSSVTTIGTDPFAEGSTVYCYASSAVESWARASDKAYNIVLLNDGSASPIEHIELDDKSVIAKGQQTDLQIHFYPPNSSMPVTFETSDPEILIVDNYGSVTGIKEGTAELIVTAGTLTARKKLQVVTPAESLKLKDVILTVGETQKGAITEVKPDSAVLNLNWLTGDSEKVSIDENGNMTARAVGNTTYTVMDVISGVQTNASIHVVDSDARIEFDWNYYELCPFQKCQLDTRMVCGDYSFFSTEGVSFSSSDEAIATVDEKGFVTAHQSGTVLITAKSVIGNASATCQVHVIQAATMNIPNGTTVIRDNAFKGTAAEVYVIPDSVTSIGAHAFADLPNAKLIILPKGIDIDPTAFEGTTAEISQ